MGSLSVLQAELSSLSLGMFGKCEWWSVPQAGLCWLDEIHSVRACVCVLVCVWEREFMLMRMCALCAPPPLTGFFKRPAECCKPVICVWSSLSMCGPVRGKDAWEKNKFSSKIHNYDHFFLNHCWVLVDAPICYLCNYTLIFKNQALYCVLKMMTW